MPSWHIRLWSNEDINAQEFEEHELRLIHAAEKGVQKADIMKYLIIRNHGGVYMDADVLPHRSLEELTQMDADLILCHDLPVTWAYMSVGFFAAKPHNEILNRCCELLQKAQLNTGDPHMHTGPRIMGLALQNKVGKIVVLPIKSFYRNQKGQQWIDCTSVQEDDENRFGSHFYARMWD